MEIGNKYTTFFFEEYEKMAEKNTFSAFLPSENKGLWCMSKVDNFKKNLAKMAVEKIVEEYLKNDSISVENINKFLNEAVKKLWTNTPENRDRIKNISILTVMIENNRMIAGNIGKNRLKIFRKNKLFEELTGNKIKEIALKQDDYILVGTEMFWELINEYEICEMLKKFENRNIVEKNLSLKIQREEKNKKSVIPFLSILVENLKEEEITFLYEKYRNEEYKNPLGFLMVMMIFLFFFVAAGKQMKYSGDKENIKNNSEIIQNVRIKLNERKLIRVQDNIESEKTVEKNYKDTDMEEIDKMVNNKSIGRTKNKRKKNMNKNFGKKIKNEKMKESLSIESLESEIQKNWEILGRDTDGNKKLEKAQL